MIKIKYVGTCGVRLVDRYRWDKANGYVCDVPEWMEPVLLAQPGGEFQKFDPQELLYEGNIPGQKPAAVSARVLTAAAATAPAEPERLAVDTRTLKTNVRRQEPPKTEEV